MKLVDVITVAVAANTSGRFRFSHRIFGPTDCEVSAFPHRSRITSPPIRAVSSPISAAARVSTP
jgi:hypothetical protein